MSTPTPTPTPTPSSRLRFELRGHALAFIEIAPGRYAAELDGKRCPMRIRTENAEVSEAGKRIERGTTNTLEQAAPLTELLRCLALGAETTIIKGAIRVSATDNWGTFRQNTYLAVEIAVAQDRVIDLAIYRAEQDEHD